MPKRKSKFIEKKSAVTWHLFDRAQNDIMCGDAAMPQVAMVEVERAKRLKERRKFGIYYEDEYDYMRHLKPRSGAPLMVDEDDEEEETASDVWGDCGQSESSAKRPPTAPSSTCAGGGGSGFVLPVELLPNEPTIGVNDCEDDDEDFFDPEIAEAIAAAEAAGEVEGDDTDDEDDKAEAIVEGDIEDDFVALASAVAPDDGPRQPLAGPASKRDIFNRFFDDDADDEGDDAEEPVAPAADRASVATSRRGRPLTYHEEVLEDQFDRLLREFQRDSADAAGCDDEPGAVDDDCGSVMTKSLYQVLERHEKELASEAVTQKILEAGRLPASDALRALASMGGPGGRGGDGSEDDNDDDSDASSLDTEDELRLWGPSSTVAPKLVPAATAGVGCVVGGSRKNMPTLLDAGVRRQRDGGDAKEEDEDSEDEDEGDDIAEDGEGAAASAEILRAKLAGVTDKRERKRIVKEHQRARRQQKKQTRQHFSKARADMRCAVRNDPFQQGRVLKL